MSRPPLRLVGGTEFKRETAADRLRRYERFMGPPRDRIEREYWALVAQMDEEQIQTALRVIRALKNGGAA